MELPPEVWTCVLAHLGPRDLCSLALVSRTLRQITSQPRWQAAPPVLLCHTCSLWYLCSLQVVALGQAQAPPPEGDRGWGLPQ